MKFESSDLQAKTFFVLPSTSGSRLGRLLKSATRKNFDLEVAFPHAISASTNKRQERKFLLLYV